MIKHVVMWKLKNYNDANTVKEKLLTMIKEIPEIKKIDVGINIKSDYTSHDIVLETYHDSEEEMYAYQKSEYHQEIAKFIPQYCSDRVCLDYKED